MKPKILYTAVKALIKNTEAKVLVLKQADPTITGGNQYHPPGGILELGESLKECVEREVEEEIGVKCKAKQLFDVGEWQAERSNQNYLVQIKLATATLSVADILKFCPQLTQREAEVMHWLILGKTNKDIAEILAKSIEEPAK